MNLGINPLVSNQVATDRKPSIIEDAEVILAISEEIISNLYNLENTLSPIIDSRPTETVEQGNKQIPVVTTVHQKLIQAHTNFMRADYLISEINRRVSL